SLCTFCGCNTTITRNHDREEGYVRTVLAEWEIYKKLVPSLLSSSLVQFHLGGGTPTFLSPINVQRLVMPFLEDLRMDREIFSGSLEVDARRTNKAQLESLRELGFRRVSMGVQGFNPEVQRLINRRQSFAETQSLTFEAR